MASPHPISVLVSPGTIISNAAATASSRSHSRISTSRNFDSAADSSAIPSAQPTNVTTKSYSVNPGTTISNAGENTNTNGTSALPSPNRNAVLPVLNGSEPAIPAAA